jgi:hypothetical protein
MRKLLLASVALIAAPTFAAGKPLAVQVTSTKAVEGAVSAVTISTTGGNGKAVKVTWVAQSGSAIAGQDFPAFYSAEATVDNKHPVIIHVPTIEDAKVEGDETFTVKATVTSGTVHPVAAGTVTILDNDVAVPPPVVMQTCPDGSVIPATQGCPVVVVTPPSDPVTIVSPTLSGLPDIASNFDRSAQLVPTVIPQSGVPDTLGAFRFICTPGPVSEGRPDRLAGPAWQVASPPVLRQHRGERELHLRKPSSNRRQHLHDAAEPLGLLDARDARREGQCRPSGLRSNLLQALPQGIERLCQIRAKRLSRTSQRSQVHLRPRHA